MRNTKRYKHKLTFLILLSLFSGILYGQAYKATPQSYIKISGTSTLHDWISEVNSIEGTMNVTLENNKLAEVKSLEFSVPVQAIESGKKRMNTLTYEALKESSHPQITFKMIEVVSISGNNVRVRGNLSIAGVTRSVVLNGTVVTSSSRITISGNANIDMTNFNITPPVAMMSTIKVDKLVNIDYKLVLTR